MSWVIKYFKEVDLTRLLIMYKNVLRNQKIKFYWCCWTSQEYGVLRKDMLVSINASSFTTATVTFMRALGRRRLCKPNERYSLKQKQWLRPVHIVNFSVASKYLLTRIANVWQIYHFLTILYNLNFLFWSAHDLVLLTDYIKNDTILLNKHFIPFFSFFF